MKTLIALLATLCGTLATAADIAVIVNPKAAVDSLSQEQVANLFLGKTASFPNGSAATPLEQTDNPVHDDFNSKVLKKDAAGVKTWWAKMQFTGKGIPPKEIGTSADIKKAVAGNPNAIGYVEKSAVDGTVKVVGTF
jgi:ABC-type phosphate transport system substrate-binding protein